MKRKCPYCGERLRTEEYEAHRQEKHSKPAFRCLDGCVRCCADRGRPLELTIVDFERIRHNLKLTAKEMFQKYCEIQWNIMPGTYTFIPSMGLRFPCGFLDGGRCKIYGTRPMHCRLFPENIAVEPGLEYAGAFKGRGYKCVDEGFEVAPERRKSIENLMEANNRELEETESVFQNLDYCVDITEEEYREVIRELEGVDLMEYDRTKRELFTKLIEDSIVGDIRAEFTKRIEAIDKRFPI